MFRKTWTSNAKLWHSIMLENYHMVIFTVNHLFVVKQSFAPSFSHMHAKVKHDWWSDLHSFNTLLGMWAFSVTSSHCAGLSCMVGVS